MATITTTSVTNPLIYPSTTLLDYTTYDGYWYAMVRASTANTFEVWRTNTGVSWSLYVSLVRANVQEIASIYTSPMGYISWAYRTAESNEDRIYYRRLSLASGSWSPEVLLTGNANGGVAGSVWGGMDLAQIDYGPSNSYQAGMVAVAQTSNGGCWLFGFLSLPGQNPQADNGVMAGNRQMLPVTTTTGHHAPSLDLEHAGNGKVASVSHLWLTYGRNRIHLNKIAWHGYGWTVPTGMVDISGAITARDYIPGRWDGNRFLMVRNSGSTVILYERNRSNTTTTTRTTPAHSQGTVRSVGVSYNNQSGNPRVYAVGTTVNDLYYVDYDRGTGNWGSWTLVSSTDITGANVDNFSPRRGTYGNAKHDIITAHAGVDIVHTAIGQNYVPLTPTWEFSTVPYVDGSAADVAASLLLDWNFNDPDPADTQGSYALSRQVGSGSLEYWRASDSTWQVAEVQNTSAVTQLTLTSTQWSTDGAANGATDPAHTYRVKTWDSVAVASNYSAGLVLIPSSKVNPSIDIPVNSSTWSANNITVTWTVAEQTAFQVQLIFIGIVIEDSGKIVSSATSYTLSTNLPDTWNMSVKVFTWNNEGLKSDADENLFTVSFVTPRTPTIVSTPNPAAGYINVKITNPPATSYVAAGTAATGNNATLNPALPAGLAQDDLALVLSAIENSGTGTPNTPSGYAALATFANVGLFGKIAGASESAPSCSYTGGAAGAATTAQTAAFRNAALASLGSPFTQLNGSAQNVSYLGGTPPAANCVMILIAWKQDGAATAFSTPAGFTQIGQTFNATGQSIAWYYQIQTAATAVSSGTVTVTSGVSAISRSVLVSLSGVPNVTHNDVYRVRVGSFGDQIRVIGGVAVNGSGNDWRAVSKQEYAYQAVAYGDNGTLAYGAFTP